jgi:hypothetical protein
MTHAVPNPPQARRENFSGQPTLPPDLIADLDGLIVDRHGASADAFMVTEDIIGHVVPGNAYRLTLDGLVATADAPNAPVPVEPTPPPHVVIDGVWQGIGESEAIDANILGGFGSFTLGTAETAVAIPEAPATAAMLAWYGAHLVAVGDVLALDATGNLPVTVTAVGESYVDDYVMVEGLGDGFYIEVHDRPHLHMPMDPDAHGHLVFGRNLDGGRYALSGFRVPYGHAVIMSPHIIHTDACLVGRYMVIYSITKDFSTVILHASTGEIAKPVVMPVEG